MIQKQQTTHVSITFPGFQRALATLSHLILTKFLKRRHYYYQHFTSRETEDQRDQVVCPQLHS